MSLVEKATKRLEQLRRAGEQVAGDLAYPEAGKRVEPAPQGTSTIDRIAQELAKLQSTTTDPGPSVSTELTSTAAPDANVDAALAEDSERREPILKTFIAPTPTTLKPGGPLPIARPGVARSRVEQIDLDELAARGILTPAATESRLANELRVIKRPLINNCLGKSAGRVKHANRIMITSALPGEGKSYVSTNLAMSIAMERDSTVLLVEADTARPSIGSTFGIPAGRGLMDLLVSPRLDVADALVTTSIDRLSFLPAGNRHEHATELLASGSMEKLIDHLASRYTDRVLIFDCPPLLAAPESRVLARYMGQIVLVVEAKAASHSTVLQALSTIETCPVVMAVLNKVSALEEKFYYYSG